MFTTIYDSIITPRCGGSNAGANCHVTQDMPGGGLVVPFEPQMSTFRQVHFRDCSTPRHSVLLGNPPLSATQIDTIETWISMGATR